MENPSNSGQNAAAADSSAANAEAGNGAPQQLSDLSAGTAEELSLLAHTALSQHGPALFAGDGLLSPPNAIPSAQAAAAAAAAADVSAAAEAFSAGSNAAAATSAESALNALLLSSGLTLSTFNAAGGLGSLLGQMSPAALAGFGVAAGAGGGGGFSMNSTGTPSSAAAAAEAEAEDEAARNCNMSGNKQLSSRWRGVCWNKKNKRWQAAINSAGKYIYLGSFTSEDDAARQFDRAAIKIRGKKAKLNFHYADYVDAEGNLLEDLILPVDAAAAAAGRRAGGKASNKATGSGSDGINYLTGGSSDMAGAAYDDGGGGVGATGDMLNQAAALVQQQAGGQGGCWGGSRGQRTGGGGGMDDCIGGGGGMYSSGAGDGSKGKQLAVLNRAAADLKTILPKGCTMDYMLPGLEVDMFGLVYKHDGTGQRGCGLWTGYSFHAFGFYVDEQDAKQTVLRGMELLHEDRQTRGAASAVGGGGFGGGLVGSRTDAGGGHGGSGAAAGGAGGGGALSSDPLMAALGLGSLRGGGGGGGTGLSTSGGLFGGGGGGGGGSSGMGGLANYDIARAAQLAQQAAAEQGMSMSMAYPPLSVGLPTGGLRQQQTAAGAAESQLQYTLQQIMQQRDETKQQQTAGGGMLSRLANLDMVQLRQQLAGNLDPQQQQLQQQGMQQLDQQQALQQQVQQLQQQGMQQPTNPIGGALGSTSIEELVAAMAGGGKRAAPGAPGAAAGASESGGVGGGASGWPEHLLALSGMASGDASGAPAVKRMRTSDASGLLAAAGSSDAAAAGTDGAAAAGSGSGSEIWENLQKVGLQDALKQLCAMSQAQG